MIQKEDYLKAKQIIQEYEKQLNISDVIKRLNIRLMKCTSGNGLMSYGYNFLQIGGYKGQSFDNVKHEEMWDGDFKKGETVLDCRNGKCVRISKTVLKEIIEAEQNAS